MPTSPSDLRAVIAELGAVSVLPGMTHVPVPVGWLQRLGEAAAAHDAGTGITEDMVDRAAAWLFAHANKQLPAPKARETWTWMPPGSRRQWTEDASALLRRALAVEGDHGDG